MENYIECYEAQLGFTELIMEHNIFKSFGLGVQFNAYNNLLAN